MRIGDFSCTYLLVSAGHHPSFSLITQRSVVQIHPPQPTSSAIPSCKSYGFLKLRGATAIFLLSGIAVRGTLLGHGPFVQPVENTSLLLLQAFMGITSLMVLVLAAAVSERKGAETNQEKLISELQEALKRIKALKGLLPICASCKKIRDDKGYWNHIESYIRQHSEADFTHGICPRAPNASTPGSLRKWMGSSGP